MIEILASNSTTYKPIILIFFETQIAIKKEKRKKKETMNYQKEAHSP